MFHIWENVSEVFRFILSVLSRENFLDFSCLYELAEVEKIIGMWVFKIKEGRMEKLWNVCRTIAGWQNWMKIRRKKHFQLQQTKLATFFVTAFHLYFHHLLLPLRGEKKTRNTHKIYKLGSRFKKKTLIQSSMCKWPFIFVKGRNSHLQRTEQRFKYGPYTFHVANVFLFYSFTILLLDHSYFKDHFLAFRSFLVIGQKYSTNEM